MTTETATTCLTMGLVLSVLLEGVIMLGIVLRKIER